MENRNEMTLGQLIADLKVVIRDAEALAIAAAGQVGEKMDEAKVHLGESLEAAKANLAMLESMAAQKAREADAVIRRNPYPAVGIAAGVGLLVGFLCTRK